MPTQRKTAKRLSFFVVYFTPTDKSAGDPGRLNSRGGPRRRSSPGSPSPVSCPSSSVGNGFYAVLFLSVSTDCGDLKFFQKTDYSGLFLKAAGFVKGLAQVIFNGAVRAHFGAAFFFCPFFTAFNQSPCDSLISVSRLHIDTFEIGRGA